MATGDASRFALPDWCCEGSSDGAEVRTLGDMRGAEAAVVAAAAAAAATVMRAEDEDEDEDEEAGREQRPKPSQPAGIACAVCGEPSSGCHSERGKPWKKFLYCEPHKRIKEVLEEELFIQRDECHIKKPSTVALEGIWSIKRNFSMGSLKPGSQNKNSLLPQPKYYSRHGGIRKITDFYYSTPEIIHLQLLQILTSQISKLIIHYRNQGRCQ
uniref:Chromosome 4 C11orf97 homolog n=1 Tax=Monodelphis domestica TaxID=13616 RepID=A0A5F8GHX9_MONDO